MKYSVFNTTPDHALNVRRALEYCREHRESGLEFEPGVYEFYPDTAIEGVYCTSNHGVNGFKRIAFLLKDMHNFTLDGGGSEFVFQGVMNPIVADACTNLTLKNFSLFTPQTCCQSGTVTAAGADWFEVEIAHEQPFFVRRGQLFLGVEDYAGEDAFHRPLTYILDIMPDKKHLRCEQGNYFVGPQDVVRKVGNHTVRFEKFSCMVPEVGHIIWFFCCARDAVCVLLQDCQNTTIQDYTAYTGIGMGLMAQNCDTVLVDRMRTICKPNRALSLNADATHFVHCTGQITVQNCHFTGQLDDALSIHGAYTRIVQKRDDTVTVKYMHYQAKGLNAFRVGDVVQAVDAESLLPKGPTCTVRTVEILNIDCTLLTLDGDVSAFGVGDDLENISRSPDLLFQNNRVEYNRARGIVLAARGKTVVRDNYFNTSGPAIKFESSGDQWYESGAVQDVTIENNVFDDCNYCARRLDSSFSEKSTGHRWGDAVIYMSPRVKTEKNRYFHGRVAVQNNTFSNCAFTLFKANNVQTAIFRNNQVTADNDLDLPQAEFVHCCEIVEE